MSNFRNLVSKSINIQPYTTRDAAGHEVYVEPTILSNIIGWLFGNGHSNERETSENLVASGNYIIETDADRKKRADYREYEANDPIRNELREINKRTAREARSAVGDNPDTPGFNPFMQAAASAAQEELGVSGNVSYLDMSGPAEWREYDECLLKHARAMEVAFNMAKQFAHTRVECQNAGPDGMPPQAPAHSFKPTTPFSPTTRNVRA